jgi:hypothetical protein
VFIYLVYIYDHESEMFVFFSCLLILLFFDSIASFFLVVGACAAHAVVSYEGNK